MDTCFLHFLRLMIRVCQLASKHIAWRDVSDHTDTCLSFLPPRYKRSGITTRFLGLVGDEWALSMVYFKESFSRSNKTCQAKAQCQLDQIVSR